MDHHHFSLRSFSNFELDSEWVNHEGRRYNSFLLLALTAAVDVYNEWIEAAAENEGQL